MPDVAVPLFSNRPMYNNGAIVYVNKNGSGTQVLRVGDDKQLNKPNPSGLIAYLDRRFDDPTFYTA